MMKKRSIIYVNFSPYENTGKILDYILESFGQVFSFSFDFHKLKKKEGLNKLRIYESGKQVSQHNLFQLPIPGSLVFVFLPIRSVIILAQMVGFCVWIRIKYGKIDYYFTPNAFTAWIGNILRIVGVVDKTIFWVWDYYPPYHNDPVIQLMRKMYWYFDKIATASSKTVFLNYRLQELRKKAGLMPRDVSYPVVPIGTDPVFLKVAKSKSGVKLGFIGVLKKSQGLDLLFDNAKMLTTKFPTLSVDVIGSGPDEEYFRKKSQQSGLNVHFHGLISEDTKDGQIKIAKILVSCLIGIAPFVPEESNVSYYGDPSKVKKYLSLGLPVITTNVFEFSPELEKAKAGIVFDYDQPDSFVEAIQTIVKRYEVFRRNAELLGKKYYYKRIYPEMFSE